jgi:hypothetical protein
MIISGAVGVGKTTVAYEVRLRLRDAGISHVLIDDEFALFYPYPDGDPRGEVVRIQALAALSKIYARAGVERLIIARAVEDSSAVAAIVRAVPGAAPEIYQLVAPLDIISERIETKRVPSARDWCVERAAELITLWHDNPLDATIIDSRDRSPSAVADEIVAHSQWLG